MRTYYAGFTLRMHAACKQPACIRSVNPALHYMRTQTTTVYRMGHTRPHAFMQKTYQSTRTTYAWNN